MTQSEGWSRIVLGRGRLSHVPHLRTGDAVPGRDMATRESRPSVFFRGGTRAGLMSLSLTWSLQDKSELFHSAPCLLTWELLLKHRSETLDSPTSSKAKFTRVTWG